MLAPTSPATLCHPLAILRVLSHIGNFVCRGVRVGEAHSGPVPATAHFWRS